MISAHFEHHRQHEDFLYVYPVIARRSRGLSIGINLNPDKRCNFDCIYCEANRKAASRVSAVDLELVEAELREMLERYRSGALFQHEPLASAPASLRRLNDIAFSGEGEPTTCPQFAEAVEMSIRLRDTLTAPKTKLVLITNATCLERPDVQAGLRQMKQGAHEVWAKLDAGTETYFKTINRTAIHYHRVLRNITETAQWMPLMIQSLFLRMHGQPPSDAEIAAYAERVNTIVREGGQILKLQLYTVARPTPETFASSLSKAELDRIAGKVQELTGLPQEIYYGKDFVA